jgi:hypothetical protein
MACPSLIYSDYPFGILWHVLRWFRLIIPVVSYGLSFFDLLWLSLWYLMACPSFIYSDYPFGILWPVLLWFILIIPLVSYGLSFFDLLWLSLWYLMAWSCLICSFWLSLWYIMACPLIYSDYPCGILWAVLLWFILIIPLVSYGLSLERVSRKYRIINTLNVTFLTWQLWYSCAGLQRILMSSFYVY